MKKQKFHNTRFYYISQIYKKNNKFIYCLLIYIFFALSRLSSSPPVWYDEGLLSEVAWQLIQHNTFAQPLWTGHLNHEQFSTHPNYLYYIFLGTTFKLLGLGIFQARFVSFFFGMMLLILLYFFVKKQFDKKTAFIVSILLATNPLFILSARIARQEMTTAFFALAAITTIIIGNQKKNDVFIFISGIFSALTTLTHLNGIFITAACFLYIGYAQHSLKKIIIYITGNFITAVPYLLFILLKWDFFKIQFFEQWNYRLPTTKLIFQNILKEPHRWFKGITTPFSILPGVLASIILTKRIKSLNFIYFPLFFILFCFLLFDYHKYYGYLLIVLPLLTILLGIFLNDIITKKQIFGIILLTLIILSSSSIAGYKILRDSSSNYERYCNNIKSIIKEDAIILADALFWFCFPHGNLRGIIEQTWIQAHTKKPFQQILKEQNIQYIILDPATNEMLHTQKRVYASLVDIPTEYIQTIESCKLIGNVTDQFYTYNPETNVTLVYEC